MITATRRLGLLWPDPRHNAVLLCRDLHGCLTGTEIAELRAVLPPPGPGVRSRIPAERPFTALLSTDKLPSAPPVLNVYRRPAISRTYGPNSTSLETPHYEGEGAQQCLHLPGDSGCDAPYLQRRAFQMLTAAEGTLLCTIGKRREQWALRRPYEIHGML